MAWIVKRNLKTGHRFYVRYSLAGHRFWFSAGKSLATAKKAKAKVETEIAEGRLLDRKKSSTWSLERLSKVYLERMAALRPRSARWRVDRFNQILAVVDRQTPIEAIGVSTLDRYAATRLAAGKSVATVKGEIQILRHAIRMAVRWEETGLAEFRLGEWHPLRGRPARAPVFLSRKQVAALLKASAALGGRSHQFLRLFLATGARPAELHALTPSALVGSHLRLTTLKHGVDRSLDLGPLAKEIALPLPSKAVVRRHWRAVRDKAGLAGVRFYDLRHTAASEMLRRGAKLREVQYVLGHSSARMTERYAHFAEDNAPPAVVAWVVPRSGQLRRPSASSRAAGRKAKG